MQHISFFSKINYLSKCLLFLLGIFLPLHATSDVAPASFVVQDMQVQETLKEITRPLIIKAGLNPHDVLIWILDSRAVNVFVTADGHLFVSTGLIFFVKNVSVFLGIVAHELGHIAHQHGILGYQRMLELQDRSLWSTIFSLGIAALGSWKGGKEGEDLTSLGIAAALGSQSAAVTDFLIHSQGQEAQADAFGMQLMAQNGYPLQGLVSFLKDLKDNEAKKETPFYMDRYLRTHPLTETRYAAVLDYAKRQSSTKVLTAEHKHWEAVRLKIGALLRKHQPLTTWTQDPALLLYGEGVRHLWEQAFVPALRAIYSYQQTPAGAKDPFAYEIKGRVYLEQGEIAKGLQAINRALQLSPKHYDKTLLFFLKAELLLYGGDSQLQAVRGREVVMLLEPLMHLPARHNPMFWRLLSVAYGRAGNIGMMALYLAEKALCEGNKEMAFAQAKRAKELLSPLSAGHQRALDILMIY